MLGMILGFILTIGNDAGNPVIVKTQVVGSFSNINVCADAIQQYIKRAHVKVDQGEYVFGVCFDYAPDLERARRMDRGL